MGPAASKGAANGGRTQQGDGGVGEARSSVLLTNAERRALSSTFASVKSTAPGDVDGGGVVILLDNLVDYLNVSEGGAGGGHATVPGAVSSAHERLARVLFDGPVGEAAWVEAYARVARGTDWERIGICFEAFADTTDDDGSEPMMTEAGHANLVVHAAWVGMCLAGRLGGGDPELHPTLATGCNTLHRAIGGVTSPVSQRKFFKHVQDTAHGLAFAVEAWLCAKLLGTVAPPSEVSCEGWGARARPEDRVVDGPSMGMFLCPRLLVGNNRDASTESSSAPSEQPSLDNQRPTAAEAACLALFMVPPADQAHRNPGRRDVDGGSVMDVAQALRFGSGVSATGVEGGIQNDGGAVATVLYDWAVDRRSMKEVGYKLDGYHGPTLMIITANDNAGVGGAFGAYFSTPWRIGGRLFGDTDCFLFRLGGGGGAAGRAGEETGAGFRVFPAHGKSDRFASVVTKPGEDDEGLSLGGRPGHPRLWVDGDLRKGRCDDVGRVFSGGALIGDRSGDREFSVTGLVVWGLGDADSLQRRDDLRVNITADAERRRKIDRKALMGESWETSPDKAILDMAGVTGKYGVTKDDPQEDT